MDKIADAFSLIRNGANIKQGLDDSGYPITRIETISNRTVDRDKMGYAGITDITKYSDYVLQDGDILMSHINSETHLGKVARYEKYEGETIIHGMNLLCLRPNKNLVDSRYAFYYLSSEAFLHQIPRITKKSVNQASFNVAALKELTFPISSMEVQQPVADILDKANELIALRKEQLAKLDELIKARFVEMFGDMILNPNSWEKVDLGTVCDVRDGTHDSPKYFAEGIPLVTSRNLSSGRIDFTDCNLICEADYNKINERSKVDLGDILMPMIGTVGNPIIVDIDAEFAIKNVALIKFSENSKVVNVFVKALLESDYFDRAVLDKVRGGTQQFISLGDIRRLNVCLPPLEVQKQFAAFVTQADKSRVAVQKALDEAQLLFDSLMQKYFG